MIEFLNSYILSFMIFFPFITGVLILVLPISQKKGSFLAFLSSMVVLVLGIYLFLDFQEISATQYREVFAVIPEYGVNYMVGVDGVNLIILMIIATSFPALHLILKSQEKGYWANMLLMQSAFMAVILAEDLIFFYAGWEAMLLPVFLMIGVYGKSKDKPKAAMNMMYYTIFGSMFMFIAIVYVGVLHYEQFGFYSFKITDLQHVYISPNEAFWLFSAFMLAFAIKTPLFPFHMWMPEAYTKAPAGVTFALSAIASKVAVYAILRFVLPLFPEQFVLHSEFFVTLGLISMIYFGVAAVAQKDFKTILAYSSASHLGLIIAGVFALNIQSTTGAIYQVIAHAMTSGIMFLLVGKIAREMKTRDIRELGGLAKNAPVFALFFAIAMVSSVGLPGTNGFIGEILMILGLFKLDIIYGVLGTFSIIIGAIYMFIIYRKAILQSTNELTEKFTDLTKKEIIAFLPVIAFIFIMGIYPKPFLEKIEPTTKHQYEKYIKPHLEKIGR